MEGLVYINSTKCLSSVRVWLVHKHILVCSVNYIRIFLKRIIIDPNHIFLLFKNAFRLVLLLF